MCTCNSITVVFIYYLYVVLNCGDPGIPLHGRRHGKLVTYRAKVWFSCHSHTTLVGILVMSMGDGPAFNHYVEVCLCVRVCCLCVRVCCHGPQNLSFIESVL